MRISRDDFARLYSPLWITVGVVAIAAVAAIYAIGYRSGIRSLLSVSERAYQEASGHATS